MHLQLVSLCALHAAASPAGDVVQALPGWEGELLSKTYSGYIAAGTDGDRRMYEHYVFFESERDPANDPVIMWTNGGPGAPSFFGAFTELGPYYVSDASLETEAYNASGVPTLFRNIYSWTKKGNLLIRNLPPPVGYSYCEPAGPSGDGYSCGDWDDNRTAVHSFEFLNNWFEAFPEYAESELYLTGESYAGIYVPTLAKEILAHADSVPARQLRGFAVGDGVTGKNEGMIYFLIEFLHGHGQFSTKTYDSIQEHCTPAELMKIPWHPRCLTDLYKMYNEIGYMFEYGLYDECYDFDLLNHVNASSPHGKTSRRLRMEDHGGYEPHHMDGAPCGGTGALSKWIKHADVKKALHVAENANYFSGDNGVGFNYKSTQGDLTSFYKHVAENTNLRVLIYNGDTDPGLNSFAAENFTRGIGLPEMQSWRPWTIDGKMRMGGFVTRYEGGLDFLTVRGSGHMVPQYKPQAALAFLEAWLTNADYPRLDRQSRKTIV